MILKTSQDMIDKGYLEKVPTLAKGQIYNRISRFRITRRFTSVLRENFTDRLIFLNMLMQNYKMRTNTLTVVKSSGGRQRSFQVF